MSNAVIIFSLALAFAAGGSAADRVPAVSKGPDGVAIRGYDPVAYFTDSKAVKGSPKFEHEWMGAKWRFASSSHRDLFTAAPEKYAPQFGGYCVWALIHKTPLEADPEVWNIVDRKLYLNSTREAQRSWESDRPRWIVDAGLSWPTLHR